MRKYPPVPFLDRRCTADYRLPGTDLVLEKGICVYVSLLGLHYDEEYFPDSEKFIPERHENKQYEEQMICAPFGFGPRSCIGELFQKIQLVK